MHKPAFVILFLLVSLALITACNRRMAPFSPHRTNSNAHQQATTNQACLECHTIADIGQGHQATDNCLRCHRILQGE